MAQEGNEQAMFSTDPTLEPKEEAAVTAVYGISADDYLPSAETEQNPLRPKVRKAASRPSFDLPDAFYFIGGPIFFLLFLRILAIFLNGFEEKRREEERTAVCEILDPE